MALVMKRVTLYLSKDVTETFDTDGSDERLLAFALVPFPMMALKGEGGAIVRYVNFPMKIEDEEQLVVAGPGAVRGS